MASREVKKEGSVQATITFSLPDDIKAAQEVGRRLDELIQMVNLEKEEQAIDPAFFTGNQADYPDWFFSSFEDTDLLTSLENFCGYERGDMEDWDLDSWYDDLFGAPTFNFKIELVGRKTARLIFNAEEADYGTDAPHGWLVLTAGGTNLHKTMSQE